MKIGIILAPYGEDKPSGLGSYVLNLTLELVRQNNDAHFYIFIKGNHQAAIFSSFSNVTIKHLPVTIFWKDIAFLQNRNIDIWLYNNPSMPFLWKPKKNVVTALDFGAFYPDQELSSMDRVKVFFLKLLQNDALNHASHVLCTSFATKTDLHRFFPHVRKEKVTVAMCGFTRICEKYTPASVDNLPEKYYLVVGVIKPRKNQLTAVKAFIHAKEKGLQSMLVICGKGSGNYFNSVMEVILNSPCKDDIIYLGYCSNEQLLTLYKKARALIFPSHIEGFGMPIVEAMSCGTPVITSSNGALGEIAERCAITVDSSDVEGFATAMQTFEDDSVRQYYVEKGYERAKEFSWEKSAIEYMHTIQKIIAK